MLRLCFAVGDGEAVTIVIESVFGVGTKEVAHEIIEIEKADDFAVAVSDEKEEGAHAEEGVQGLFEGIVGADEIETGIEDVGDMAGFADIEVVKMGGMNTTDEIAFLVLDWEVRKTGAIETVESKRAEDFVGIDVNNLLGGEHNFRDLDGGKVEEVDDSGAFALAKNAVRGLGDNFENVGASFRGVVERVCDFRSRTGGF